jgi:hypothetical protein
MAGPKIAVHKPAEVVPIFRDLLGKPITVKDVPPIKAADGFYCVATYDREDGTLGAACAMDLQLAASLAAALILVPKGIADDCIRAKKLEDMLEESLQEVFNVSGRFFNSATSPRVILKWRGKPPLPPPAQAFFTSAPTRFSMEIGVPGYLSGKMVLCAN